MKVEDLFTELRHFFRHSVGVRFFYLGLFLLPSSAFLAGICLVIAMALGSLRREDSYWRDNWNYPFFLVGIFMIFGSIRAYSGWLAWIGLANWLPFFWAFWAFQPFLANTTARRRSAFWLVAGTVPVVITGFGQLWWGWHGPWQLFDGLIIWFVSAGGEPVGRLSGLFDYANIAGAWLACIWPLSLALLLEPCLTLRRRFIVFLLVVAIVAALVLTDSRNAWGGLFLAIPFVLGSNQWFWLFPLLILTLIPVCFAVLPWFGLELQMWARQFVPDAIWMRLNDMRYTHERVLASTRLGQWEVAIQFILDRPWFGWGAAAFSVLYPLRTGQWHGHAHNLPLELSVSHGLPVTILFILTVLGLLIIAVKRGVLGGSKRFIEVKSKQIFDRAWWTATFILVVLHGADMPFFDSRLNIVGWVLLAGLRCLIKPAHSNSTLESGIVVDVGSKIPT